MSERRCPGGGKRCIPTEREAKAELVGAIIKANKGSARRKECRYYLCGTCNTYHLTSMPAPPPNRK